MPVVAIIPAIAAVSSVGMAGFGAVLAGTATLGTTFAAIGAVGATLGAIGEIAGVKELKTAGLVLGGIGGVGSLANAVGAFGEGASLNSVFGSATSEAATGTSPATGMINGGFNQASDSADDILGASAFSGTNAGGTSDDVFSAINHISGATPMDESSLAQGPAGTDNLAGASIGVRQQTVDKTAPQAKQTNPGMDTESVTVTGQKDVGAAVTGNTKGPPPNPTLGQNFTNDESGASYQWDGKQWVNKPSFWGSNSSAMLGMGVVQAAGSFLSGATDELKPAQVKAYEAQAAANNAQAGLATKELSNMNSNIPAARRVGVTGGVGMINR